MLLNLDNNFKPFLNDTEIAFESFVFAGGEPHIKIAPFNVSQAVTITHRINSFNDLGLLLIAVDALQRMKVKTINAFIPYFPAARQDRLMQAGEPLTVKVYTQIINALQLNNIQIYDAHSDVTGSLLSNCEVVDNKLFIAKVVSQLNNNLLLISPDGGALKKIYKLAQNVGGREVIECSKTRDVKTGKLSGFKVYADDLQGKDCLIVDDICDGGGTFIGLAQALKAKNAGKLYLAVSHGIFSKGTTELASYFDGIFTTNSIKNTSDENIIQIEMSEVL
jgi:ribose-phosphate pyrophosphokinase